MGEPVLAVTAVAIFATLEALYYLVRWVADRRAVELRRRLQAMGKGVALDADLLRRGRLARSAAVGEVVGLVPGARALERLLEQADSPWTVAQLAGLSAAGAVLGPTLGVTLHAGSLANAGLGLVGACAPTLSVLGARAKRSRKLSEQLPEALDTMARSLRAGHAMSAAFQVVASELPEPICVEFARAYDEQRMGMPLERAVLQMSARSPGNTDLKIFAVSAVIQRETGGNLAEILANIADTIRQRYRFHGKLRALTGEGRASAVILGVLPFVVTVLISIIHPGYLTPLSETDTGRRIVLFAAASWTVGLLWLYRLTKVEI